MSSCISGGGASYTYIFVLLYPYLNDKMHRHWYIWNHRCRSNRAWNLRWVMFYQWSDNNKTNKRILPYISVSRSNIEHTILTKVQEQKQITEILGYKEEKILPLPLLRLFFHFRVMPVARHTAPHSQNPTVACRVWHALDKSAIQICDRQCHQTLSWFSQVMITHNLIYL